MIYIIQINNMLTKFLNSLYAGEERHKDFLRFTLTPRGTGSIFLISPLGLGYKIRKMDLHSKSVKGELNSLKYRLDYDVFLVLKF